MNEKTIFITGATDGIGRKTTYDLAKMGHKLFIHGRNPSKCEATASDIIASS